MAEVVVTQHSGESVYIRTEPVSHCIHAWDVINFATALEDQGAPDDTQIEFNRNPDTFHLTALSCRFHRAEPTEEDSS
jgi:hypothetical protein